MRGIWMLGLVGCGLLQRDAGEAGGRVRDAAPAQPLPPIEQIDTYLDALHVARGNPDHVAEVHHYCDEVDETLIQCALYDGPTRRARLVGVEYVLTSDAFERLPPSEKQYWHPHNYEVLSGMLVAPGMEPRQERRLMERLLNTYGKTWHTWPIGPAYGDAPRLPVGEPELAWSFNADNEAPEALVRSREQRLDLDMDALRRSRADLIPNARPQEGVNAMAEEFPNRRPIRGVREEYPTDRQRGTD
jgi:hypothetical protein